MLSIWLFFHFLILSSAIFIPNNNIRDDHDDDDDDDNNDNSFSNDKSQFFVNSSLIPGFDPNWNDKLLMYSGHIPVSDDLSTLFFWNFKSPNNNNNNNNGNDKSRPLIIWLNGGPGCSSMDGALMEIGPLRIPNYNDNKENKYNDIHNPKIIWNDGWFKSADLLFIDQPIGTGFSTKSINDNFDSNLMDSSIHLLNFLENYFQIFNNLDDYTDLIIAGESYAGQYIPHIANLIVKSSKFNNKLKAILLGNAWLDPNLQSLSYLPFAIQNNIINPHDQDQQSRLSLLLNEQDICQNIRNSKEGKVKFSDPICDSLLTRILALFMKEDQKCINVYDIRKVDSYPACGNNWPEILSETTNFLNLPTVQDALNVNNVWKECNNNVHSNFNPPDDNKIGADLLNDLLDNGIKVNLFSGLSDMICNYLGTEMVIKEHIKNYLNSNNFKINLSISNSFLKRDIEKFQMDAQWLHDDSIVGSFWQRGNLTYIQINNASHMVPYDYSLQSIGILDLALRDYDPDLSSTVNTYTEKDRQLGDTKNINNNNDHDNTTTNNNNNNNNLNNKYILSRRLIAIILLFIILSGLSVYLYMIIKRKPRHYSALANTQNRQSTYTRYAYEWVSGNNNKNKQKKRVHWIDEHIDPMIIDNDELSSQIELEDLNLNNNSKNLFDQDLESDILDKNIIKHPREGSFEEEEEALQLESPKNEIS
jgi:carboxypeptidase D